MRSPRAIAVLEVSRVLYRRLGIHPSQAYAIARDLDRFGLINYGGTGGGVTSEPEGTASALAGDTRGGVGDRTMPTRALQGVAVEIGATDHLRRDKRPARLEEHPR